MTEYVYAQNGHTHVLRMDGPDVVRGVAHPTQLDLLESIADERPLEVCSINWLRKLKPKSLDELLEALTHVDGFPSYGGWRAAEQDLVCLKVARFDPLGMTQISNRGGSELSGTVLAQHPAVREGFLFPFPDGIPFSAMALLRLIYDLRRFSDPDHPSKKYFLRDYFKLLTPQRFFRFYRDERTRVEDVPVKIMLDAWYEQPLQEAECNSERFASCRAFLFQKYDKIVNERLASQPLDEALPYALWKVTSIFCDFVQLAWQKGLGDGEFDPAQFFEDEKLTEEFFRFIKRVDKGLDISNPLDRPTD